MKSILIVEDNDANMELMCYLLETYGYAVLQASDANQALALVAEHPLLLIICDIQLPEITGFELIKRFNALDRLVDVPIIAVSAYAMVGDRERILSAGFDGYLAKPIEPQSFVSRIETYLPEHMRSSLSPTGYSEVVEPGVRAVDKILQTILLVDDTQDNLDVLTNILEPSGYNTIQAHSTPEAQTLLETCRPDLIIADLNYPDEKEFGLLDWLMQQSHLKHIPFICISSTNPKVSLVQKSRKKGATRFLFRPLEPQALLSEIEAVFHG